MCMQFHLMGFLYSSDVLLHHQEFLNKAKVVTGSSNLSLLLLLNMVEIVELHCYGYAVC